MTERSAWGFTITLALVGVTLMGLAHYVRTREQKPSPIVMAASPTPLPSPVYSLEPGLAQWSASNVVFNAVPEWEIRIYTRDSGDPVHPRVISIQRTKDHHTLDVYLDGTVKGNLPHDEAATQFWKAMARSYPMVCEEVKK